MNSVLKIKWFISLLLIVQLQFAFGQLKKDTVVNGESFNYYSLYKNGKLNELGNYKNGLKTGHWIHYYSNGQKQKEGNYVIMKIVRFEDTSPGEEKATKPREVVVKKSVPQGFWKYWTIDGKCLSPDEIEEASN